MTTLSKMTFGAIAVAAALAFGGLAPSPAAAQSPGSKPVARATASDTDFSAQWRYRRYGYVRPRPYYYRPYYYANPYPYAYAPAYYQPYYAPGPFLGVGFGFGRRHYW